MGGRSQLARKGSSDSPLAAGGRGASLRIALLWPALFAAAHAYAQSGCTSVPVWSTCDLAFDLNPQEDPAQADLRAEFRSPKHRTYLLRAFAEGRRMVFRFAPTEDGAWEYRLSSSLPRFQGQMGTVNATESPAPGFVQTANVHHFATEGLKPHLWMGAPIDNFAEIPRADFDRILDARARDKFTHVRVTIAAATSLNEAANRIRAINEKGLVADLVLAGVPGAAPQSAAAPQPPAGQQDGAAQRAAQQRERYLRDIVARFSAFNITWAGIPEFENIPHGRALAKEVGATIQKLDPYEHPRATLAAQTSGPLISDGWMSILTYGTADPNIGSVEHQFYQRPAVNTNIRTRQDLWNATMNGQYPAAAADVDATAASGSALSAAMKAWAEFISQSRYWELEPYFDVDGGRAVALEGVEYLVYVEKPALVELTVENHNYDVLWMNPATGETIKAKDYKGEHFTGEPPDKSHDWVLRVSREGRKEGMLRSYKFDSRPVPIQEIEQDPTKVPFEISAPSGEEISLAAPPAFGLKIKRQSRATRSLLVEWTGEAPADGEGYRVVGAGLEGTLSIPPSIASKFPAVIDLRIMLLNANGKAYSTDRVYRLVR
jgi:hypothetical protein